MGKCLTVDGTGFRKIDEEKKTRGMEVGDEGLQVGNRSIGRWTIGFSMGIVDNREIIEDNRGHTGSIELNGKKEGHEWNPNT